MKRIISLFLAATLIFSLTACGGTDSGATGGSTSTPKQLEYPFGVTNKPMEVGVTYPYKTLCYQDENEETTGFVTITSYTVTPADVEGYVNKTVKAKIVYNDDNAYWFGMQSRVLYADFDQGGDGLMDAADNWTVEVDGKTGQITVLSDFFDSQGWDNRVFVTEYELSICMPEWYDGIALFFYNAKNAIGLGDEDGELPDGTPIRDMLDGDTQWFVFGSEDQKYYGTDYEKQFSDIVLDEPVAQPPLLEPEYGNDPPILEEEYYYEDEQPEYYTFVDIDYWNKYELNRNEETTLEIHYSTYNTYEEFYVVARIYAGDMDKPVFEKKLEAYDPEESVYNGKVTFTVTPEDLADADVLDIAFSLYDFEDFELSGANANIPIN